MVLGQAIQALTHLQEDISKIFIIGPLIALFLGPFIAILTLKQIEGRLNLVNMGLQALDWLMGLPDSVEISMPDFELRGILRFIVLITLAIVAHKVLYRDN